MSCTQEEFDRLYRQFIRELVQLTIKEVEWLIVLDTPCAIQLLMNFIEQLEQK